MKYIKTFESFNSENFPKVDETMDMFTMPVDPIKGAAQVYSDIAHELGAKFKEAVMKVEDAAESVVEELGTKAAQVLKSVEHYFGAPADRLTYEMIVAKLEKANESFVDKYDAADPYNGHGEHMGMPVKDVKGGIVQKIGHVLQNIFGINILSFGLIGSFLTWMLGVAQNPAMSMVYSIIGFVVVHIIRKLVAMAGH